MPFSSKQCVESSLFSLSVPSNFRSSAPAASADAKRKEEEDRMKVINELELHPTHNIARKKHCAWRKPYYFCSTLKGHKNDIYCMKCRRWIAGGGISHVKQHESRHHAGCGENTIDSGADMQQLQVNQTVAYSAGEQARLTAKLVVFLIRDSRPAALTLDKDFRAFLLALNPKFIIPDTKKIRTVTNAMYNAARDTVLDYIHPLKQKGPSALRGMVACVSLDMWTDATQMTYIGVLLHTI